MTGIWNCLAHAVFYLWDYIKNLLGVMCFSLSLVGILGTLFESDVTMYVTSYILYQSIHQLWSWNAATVVNLRCIWQINWIYGKTCSCVCYLCCCLLISFDLVWGVADTRMITIDWYIQGCVCYLCSWLLVFRSGVVSDRYQIAWLQWLLVIIC